MKLFTFLVVLLVSVNAANAQEPPPSLQTGQLFQFEYLTADFTKFAITKFERQFDSAAPWTTISQTGAVDNPTATGKLYRFAPPALTEGLHTVTIRACSSTQCSAPLSMAFSVELIPAVFNIQIISKPVPPIAPPKPKL